MLNWWNDWDRLSCAKGENFFTWQNRCEDAARLQLWKSHSIAIAREIILSSGPCRRCGMGDDGWRPTWFWIRSLIRSMGAAAVLETAAETPPTNTQLVLIFETSLEVAIVDNCKHQEPHILRKSTTKPYEKFVSIVVRFNSSWNHDDRSLKSRFETNSMIIRWRYHRFESFDATSRPALTGS